MIWEHWLIAISILIIAIAFVVLCVFVILALNSMKQMLNDIDQKVHSFDPLFRVLNRAGSVIEKKADQELADVEDAVCRGTRKNGVTTAVEIAEWALIGVTLWQKIKDKRR